MEDFRARYRNAPDVHARRRDIGAGDESMHVMPAGREARRHAAEVRLRPAAQELRKEQRDVVDDEPDGPRTQSCGDRMTRVQIL